MHYFDNTVYYSYLVILIHEMCVCVYKCRYIYIVFKETKWKQFSGQPHRVTYAKDRHFHLFTHSVCNENRRRLKRYIQCR